MSGKEIQCTTMLTTRLITLIATIPISTLQHVETSPLSPHSTPEHDFIGQHAKTLQAGGQEDQPRSASHGQELFQVLSATRDSPFLFRLRFRCSRTLTSHSHSHSSPLGMHVKHVSWKKGTKDRECGSPSDYDIERLVSRMEASFKVTHHSMFAVCLLSHVYFRVSIIATRPQKHKATRSHVIIDESVIQSTCTQRSKAVMIDGFR
jgi:hypothetical protein